MAFTSRAFNLHSVIFLLLCKYQQGKARVLTLFLMMTCNYVQQPSKHTNTLPSNARLCL